MKKKDINNTKEFNIWIKKTFDWMSPWAKELMFKAWCKSAKISCEQVDSQFKK